MYLVVSELLLYQDEASRGESLELPLEQIWQLVSFRDLSAWTEKHGTEKDCQIEAASQVSRKECCGRLVMSAAGARTDSVAP